MLRKRINRTRRKFAYEGQEDIERLERVGAVFVKGSLIPPFSVEILTIDEFGNEQNIIWSGVEKLISYHGTVDSIVEVEDGVLMLPYHDDAIATRSGNEVRID